MVRKWLVGCLLLNGLALADEPDVEDPRHEAFKLTDLLPHSLQRNPKVDLTVMTVMTEAGRMRPVPTAQAPAYYVTVDGGRVEEGDTVAGDAWPSASELARVLGLSLAKGGYLPADAGHPPAVVIHYRWGIFNRLRTIGDDVFATGERLPDLSDAVQMRNFAARATFVGGEKFAREFLQALRMHSLASFRTQSWQTDDLVSLVFRDLYVVLASGYDYAALQRGEKTLLWKTRIATDSHGLVLQNALPSLVFNAGAHIGHETGSVRLRRRLMPGRVEIGEPVFEEYKEPLPPADSGRAQSKR